MTPMQHRITGVVMLVVVGGVLFGIGPMLEWCKRQDAAAWVQPPLRTFEIHLVSGQTEIVKATRCYPDTPWFSIESWKCEVSIIDKERADWNTQLVARYGPAAVLSVREVQP